MTQEQHPIVAAYDAFVKSGTLQDDPAQRAILPALVACADTLAQMEQRSPFSKALSRLRGKPAPVRGLYLHGEVGRGKSFLMDLFFRSAPTVRKHRVHFHAFSNAFHQKVHAMRVANNGVVEDPVPEVAAELLSQYSLLCMDEMQIGDVGDALIFRRLFSTLMQGGMMLVFTSNREPEGLYQDVLQRDRFLEFARFLREHCNVVKIESPTDYRVKALRAMDTVYFTPLGPEADAFAELAFLNLSQGQPGMPGEVEVNGRKVLIPRCQGDVAMASFHDWCANALGAADYREIATEFRTVVLTGIPKIPAENSNEAKRFVTLIDEFYERRVKLICTAAVEAAKICESGPVAFEFARTVSRLMEMQSEAYLSQAGSVS